MIRLFEPTLDGEELNAIAGVFEDRWPGFGPRVKAFERAFAEYVGVSPEQMIAVTSCTEGLFQSVAALQLDPRDEVILPTISFIGAAHAVRAAGATIRLIDVDPLTLNPSSRHFEAALTRRTRAALLLHFGGRLDSICEIAKLAKEHAVVLIEDSACALGGKYNGVSYGIFGNIGVWSFDAMKLLVTGDGGMIRVEDEALRNNISRRVRLGGSLSGLTNVDKSSGRWWEIVSTDWGRNASMNDLAAAIGLTQLNRIEGFIRRRRHIAHMYNEGLADIPWMRIPPSGPAESVPYFYWVQMPPRMRDDLAVYLRNRQVYTTFRYWPLHKTTLYADRNQYPGADLASSTTLLLPVHQNLSDVEVARIIEAIHDFKV